MVAAQRHVGRATDADFYCDLDTEWPPKTVESLHRSSAGQTFGQAARKAALPSARNRKSTPGPDEYYVEEVRTAFNQIGAVMGTGPRMCDQFEKECFPGVKDGEYFVPTGDEKYQQSRRAVFGRASRIDSAVDPELVRSGMNHGLLEQSPGLEYTPQDRATGGRNRPRSAGPSHRFSTAESERLSTKPPTTKETPFSGEDGALGKQWSSKRSTRPASSFGRAPRFPTAKRSEGQLTAECKQAPHFGEEGVASRHRRPSSASFGSATRDGSSRTRICRAPSDRPASASRARISHPPVPPRQETIRLNRGVP